MRMLMFLLCVGCLFLAGCPSVPDLYVEADRLTYEAIAPRYEKYLDDDTAIDDSTRDLRKNTLKSWDARLRAAEEE